VYGSLFGRRTQLWMDQVNNENLLADDDGEEDLDRTSSPMMSTLGATAGTLSERFRQGQEVPGGTSAVGSLRAY
jgi:hypothetical protein